MTDAMPTPTPADRVPKFVVLGLAFLLAIIAFFPGLEGKFVYDDNGQIAQNPTIMSPELYWKALTSDVWAFKGSGNEAASNYWRPVFVGWMIGNYKAFGLEPAGWKVANVFAHLAAVFLGYLALKRLRFSDSVTAVAIWLFALHPTRVESVSWIGGSPDPLLAIFLFGSILFFLNALETKTLGAWIGTCGCFLFALWSKEVAMLFPAFMFFVALWREPKDGEAINAKSAFRAIAPLLGVLAVYVVMRILVLQGFQTPSNSGIGLISLIASVPLVLGFYLLHAVLPANLSPEYGLFAVDSKNIGLLNFWLPLAIVLALAIMAWRIAKSNRQFALGMILFILPLAPALQIQNFINGQITHDRYLYLPLMGLFLALGVLAVQKFGAKAWTTFGGVASVVCSGLTFMYAPVWNSDISLWQRAIERAPDAAYCHTQYGAALAKEKNFPEAEAAYRKGLEIDPNMTLGNVGLALVLIQNGKPDEAIPYCDKVLAAYPDFAMAYDAKGQALVAQNKIDEAKANYRTAKDKIPAGRIYFAQNVATLAMQQQKPTEALEVLESILPELEKPCSAEDLTAFVQLADLYRGKGDHEKSKQMLEAYMKRTEGLTEKGVLQMREQVKLQL